MLNDILLLPINKIKKLIGTTTDTGGNSTSGTVMGKLNHLISNDVSSTIGETTDTGATETAGTVMGKLNKIIAGGGMATYVTSHNTPTGSNIEAINISGAGELIGIYAKSSSTGNCSYKIYADGRNVSQSNIENAASEYFYKVNATSYGGMELKPATGITIGQLVSIKFSKSLKIVISNSKSTAVNNYFYYNLFEN